MERLTFEGNFCDIAQCAEIRGGSFCEDGYCSQRKVWERLKEYEDTGMVPTAFDNARKLEEALAAKGYSISRLVELATADADGLVIVLPCQSGEHVFALLDGKKYVSECEAQHIVLDGWRKVFAIRPIGDPSAAYYAPFGAFGQTVFLTREEAEKALEVE